MKTIGIISYQVPHLKTEQMVLRLADRYDLIVYGLPFVQRPSREILFQHRPDQAQAADPAEVCAAVGARYIPIESDTQIDNGCDLYLMAAGKLLSAECLKDKQVLNAHPGVIPAVRGLDAFKWAIYNKQPVGVTLHFIDEHIDEGTVISVTETPVFSNDTLSSFANRHYESEICQLCNFEYHLAARKNPFADIALGESTRRMKKEMEAELEERFIAYKECFAHGRKHGIY